MYLYFFSMCILYLYIESQVLVIVACASLDRLDAALIRPGRLALHYHLTYPCLNDLYEIAEVYLTGLGGLVDGGDKDLTPQKIISLLLSPPPLPTTAPTPFIFGDAGNTNNNNSVVTSCGGVIGSKGRLLTGSDVVALFQRAKLVAMRECIHHIDTAHSTQSEYSGDVKVEYKMKYTHFLGASDCP